MPIGVVAGADVRVRGAQVSIEQADGKHRRSIVDIDVGLTQAINHHGGFGRWAFLEVADPWDAQNLIRGFLKQAQVESTKEIAHG